MKTDKELIAEYKKLLQLEFPEDAAYLIIAAEDEILRRLALAGPQNGQGWEPVLGKIVRVDNPRFNGFGFATADSGERKRVISVLLENGNVWDYDADTVRPATPEEMSSVPQKIRMLIPAPPTGGTPHKEKL